MLTADKILIPGKSEIHIGLPDPANRLTSVHPDLIGVGTQKNPTPASQTVVVINPQRAPRKLIRQRRSPGSGDPTAVVPNRHRKGRKIGTAVQLQGQASCDLPPVGNTYDVIADHLSVPYIQNRL